MINVGCHIYLICFLNETLQFKCAGLELLPQVLKCSVNAHSVCEKGLTITESLLGVISFVAAELVVGGIFRKGEVNPCSADALERLPIALTRKGDSLSTLWELVND